MYEINDLKFKTKKSVYQYTKKLLEGIPFGEKIDESHKNYKFIHDLVKFKNLARFNQELDYYVLYIMYSKSVKNLRAVFKNKFEKNVSWVDCTKQVNTVHDKLGEAMRAAIASQIHSFSNSCENSVCVECSSEENICVDHKTTSFIDLKNTFINNLKVSVPTEFYRNKFSIHEFLPDSDFSYDWQEYHHDNADFQLLCRSCNSSKGKN